MFYNVQPELEYASMPYYPHHHIGDYDGGLDCTIMFLIFGLIILVFRLYSHGLQRIGKLVKLFKECKTDEGELICDVDWKFMIDVDE